MDLLRHLVFENPTTLLVALAIATVVCGTIWRRRGASGCRLAAVVCVAAGLLVGVLAYTVETDRERLVRTLDVMDRAVDAGRAEAFIACISPAYKSDSLDKDGLANLVRRGLEYVRASAEAPQLAIGDTDAVVTQTYRFRPAPGTPLTIEKQYERITWEGVFGPDADGKWRLRSARATHPREMLPQEAARLLPGRRP
ncbi:MAG: hypothetical protein ISS74_00125 [Planctomycetes bacterium]|nr:hypothetical protein [Planctomycetota bacterium]